MNLVKSRTSHPELNVYSTILEILEIPWKTIAKLSAKATNFPKKLTSG